MSNTWVWTGRKPCGCIVAAGREDLSTEDERKHTAMFIGEMVLEGLAVERVSTPPPVAVGGCRCGKDDAGGDEDA